MSKTKRLRDSIEAELHKAADIRYRHKAALPLWKPPFGVYLLKLVRKEDGIEQYDLTLDVSGYSQDEDDVEAIADKIAAYMDYHCYLDDYQTWESYLTNRFSIEEKDVNIQRQRLTFELRYVERINEV